MLSPPPSHVVVILSQRSTKGESEKKEEALGGVGGGCGVGGATSNRGDRTEKKRCGRQPQLRPREAQKPILS